MKTILTHPTGNAFVRAAAEGLLDAGILGEFDTTIANFPGSLLDKLSSFSSFAEFKRRSFPERLRNITYTDPTTELLRQLFLKAKMESFTKHETGKFSVDAVYNNFDRNIARKLNRLSKKEIDTIYAYEDGAFYSFNEAKRLGMRRVYDLPIGYWRASQKMLQVESDKWPEWRSTLIGLDDSQEKRDRKDYELSNSDLIIVASTFTASTLKEFPGKLPPIEIIPYGFPPVASLKPNSGTNKSKLKVLFVGGLSQRKGLAELFTVAHNLSKHIELTIVGKKFNEDCEILNKELNNHRWIPSLPHNEILSLMRENDLLIFPSLFEGFGLVITEAMSQGTPVITTDRTAGPDLIEHGENGWLYEAGNLVQLQSTIEDILSNRDKLNAIRLNAIITAEKRPWSQYGIEIAKSVGQLNKLPVKLVAS